MSNAPQVVCIGCREPISLRTAPPICDACRRKSGMPTAGVLGTDPRAKMAEYIAATFDISDSAALAHAGKLVEMCPLVEVKALCNRALDVLENDGVYHAEDLADQILAAIAASTT